MVGEIGSFIYLVTYGAMIIAVFLLLRTAFTSSKLDKRDEEELWKDFDLSKEDTKLMFGDREKAK